MPLPIVPLARTPTPITVVANSMVPSRQKALGCTTTGAIRAVMPNIKSMLAMLLPTTLPMAIPGAPAKDASMLVTNSGEEVPKPTMVSPTINGETPKRLAAATAPRTNNSPPAISPASPRKISKICISSGLPLGLDRACEREREPCPNRYGLLFGQDQEADPAVRGPD